MADPPIVQLDALERGAPVGEIALYGLAGVLADVRRALGVFDDGELAAAGPSLEAMRAHNAACDAYLGDPARHAAVVRWLEEESRSHAARFGLALRSNAAAELRDVRCVVTFPEGFVLQPRPSALEPGRQSPSGLLEAGGPTPPPDLPHRPQLGPLAGRSFGVLRARFAAASRSRPPPATEPPPGARAELAGTVVTLLVDTLAAGQRCAVEDAFSIVPPPERGALDAPFEIAWAGGAAPVAGALRLRVV